MRTDGETDTSDWGYGYEIRVITVPIIRRGRLWSEAQEKWRGNRKEHYVIVQSMVTPNDFPSFARDARLVILRNQAYRG